MSWERLPSGSPHLDAVLGGGVPLHSIAMIIGKPGTGKTILAQQYLFRNASADKPALYLSTVSEPLEKMLRYGQVLDYFDPAALGQRVFYDDLGQAVNDDGLSGVLTRITQLIKQRRPAMIVIDSFKALRAYAPDAGAFRRFLHDLAGSLSALPISTFWVGEYDSSSLSDDPEFAVADAIVSLIADRDGEREIRYLQVLKLRGGEFMTGKHAYRLSSRGLDVFPRLADPADPADIDGRRAPAERVSSGVPALDAMLDGGYWRGTSTLVAGPSGVGKSLLTQHFIFAGAQRGETGVIATLQESPAQLEQTLRGFTWSLNDPHIQLMYRTPVDLYVDQWVYELLDIIERTDARRVAIDSIGDLWAATGSEPRLREYLYSFLQRCARANVSVMMTHEVPDLFGITRLSEYSISHLSDNVLLLQYLRGESTLKRALTVLKTRGAAHEPHLRQYAISSEGLSLGEQFVPEQSLA